MKRFRLWRLTRAYQRAAILELRLDNCKEATDLRVAFANETLKLVKKVRSAQGMTRQQQRAEIRQLMSGVRDSSRIAGGRAA